MVYFQLLKTSGYIVEILLYYCPCAKLNGTYSKTHKYIFTRLKSQDKKSEGLYLYCFFEEKYKLRIQNFTMCHVITCEISESNI